MTAVTSDPGFPTPSTRTRQIRILAFVGLLALVLLTYANHFNNDFHFDDTHAIVNNPYIRSTANIPLFFKDGRTSSTLPENRTYRPVVTTSLAIDYALAKGYRPPWFHISTFFWYLVQIGLMYVLFRRVCPENVALFATAIYAVHPAMAETVNYIIQRADLYSTLGVVAGIVVYAEFPHLRRFGLYLIPAVLGVLSKASASVFPALLLLWIWLFDAEDFRRAILRSIPAFGVVGATAAFVARMNPATYVTGAVSAFNYRITQPSILLGYFRKFFLPLDLSADTDHLAATTLANPDVLVGFAFVIAMVAFAWWCTRRRELRPIAFGLAWFLISSLPTSLIALSEVENDHRMFLPFVGLTLAVSCGLAFIVRNRIPAKVLAPACALLIAGFAWGAHQRNKVWATDEALWYDVTQKSPNNGRGLMNYGLTQMSKGHTDVALAYFNRALNFNPNYYILEINLGIANTMLGNPVEGERHFKRALDLSPNDASSYYYYARWLNSVNRRPEAIALLETGSQKNPDFLQARYLLMQIYADAGDPVNLTREARETLARFPDDAPAASWLARSSTIKPAGITPTGFQPPSSASANSRQLQNFKNADAFVAQSLALFRAGKYQECIQAAQTALKLRPDYAEAWNNIGAAYNQLGNWDQGIAAETQALRISPNLDIARNNLAFALSQKQKMAAASGK